MTDFNEPLDMPTERSKPRQSRQPMDSRDKWTRGPKKRPTVASEDSKLPRLLLTRNEAARSLGMSLRHFQRHVQPSLPCVYCGQLRLYRLRDLDRWVDTEACPPERVT